MSKHLKHQAGFTLIELVMVIVILGILAVVALPRFTDLSSEAQQAALDGVTGAMASAHAINYATCVAGSSSCVNVDNCDDTPNLMQGGVPNGYTITAGAIGTSVGDTANCTVTQTVTGNTRTFTGIRTQ